MTAEDVANDLRFAEDRITDLERTVRRLEHELDDLRRAFDTSEAAR